MSSQFFRVPKSRRAALAGGAALVMTAAAAHAVSAEFAPPEAVAAPGAPETSDVLFFAGGDPAQRRDDWLKAVAGKLGVTTDTLQQAITDAGPMPPMLIGGIAGPAGGAFQLAIKSPFASAATALNISEEQLRKEQAAGKSLNDIARAHNVDPKVVADALKTQRKSELDTAVSNGVMTQAIADKLKATVADEIDHIMQAVPNVSPDGRGMSIHLEWSPSAP